MFIHALIRKFTAAAFASAFLLAATETHANSRRGAPTESDIQRRIAASYEVLRDREPALSDIEIELLNKAQSFLERTPEFAQAMLEDIVFSEAPSKATFNFVLGNIYVEQDKIEEAKEQFLIAVRKFPPYQRAWSNLGIIYYQQNRFSEAVRAINRAIELGARDAFTYGMLGYSLRETGKYIASELAYNQAIIMEPDESAWIEGRVEVLFELGRQAEAKFLVEELLRRQPHNHDWWVALSNCWIALDEPLKAARSLEIAKRYGTLRPESYYNLGNIYLNAGIHDLATEAYRTAINLSPATDGRHALLATHRLLREGAISEARLLFSTIDTEQDRWPLDWKTRYALLEAGFAEAAGNQTDRLEALKNALRLDPLHGESLYRIAEAFLDSDQHDQATIYFQRIPEDSAFRYNALLHLARMQIDRQNFRGALPFVEEARSLMPGPSINTLYSQIHAAINSQPQG